MAELRKENERIRGLNDSLLKKSEGLEETVRVQAAEIEPLRANASAITKEVDRLFGNWWVEVEGRFGFSCLFSSLNYFFFFVDGR